MGGKKSKKGKKMSMEQMYSKKVLQLFKNPHNMGEIKNADGIGKVGNPVCLPPEAIIHIHNSLEPIKDTEKHSKVLGHEGLYNKVLKTFKRKYNGELIEVKNKLGLTLLTPEHMILAMRVPKSQYFSHYRNKKGLPVGWYHASGLEKRDVVLYPIMKEVIDKDFLIFEQKKKKWDHRSIKIPKNVPLNEDFLRLAGYYLSEGYLKDKVTKTYVGFAFGIREEKLADDAVYIVKRVFGIDAKKKIKKKRNTIVVEVNNVWITRLFKKLFGVGADKKKIPRELMLLPPEKQKSLIYGLWKGDGYFNLKKPRAGYSTISKELCHQLKILLLRQKIVPSIYIEEEREKNEVKHRKAYRIHIGERESLKNLAKILKLKFKINKKPRICSWFTNDHLFIPITRTKKIQYDGFVHNLEIENTRSYLTESLTVHNCGDVMWVYIKVGKNKDGEEIIKDIKVKTFGCIAAIATSSLTTDLAKGKTLKQAMKIRRDVVSEKLGGLPKHKEHCSNLAADALHKAIEDYWNKKREKGKNV